MKRQGKLTIVFLLILLLVCFAVNGQSGVSTSGGNATGEGGSVTYTLGQLAFSAISGSNGFIIQGVQQPYEISTVTGMEEEGISLEYSVYPNPTSGVLRLIIRSFEDGRFSYELYDLHGRAITRKDIAGIETELTFDELQPSVYFLRVIRDNKEVRIFKIVKR